MSTEMMVRGIEPVGVNAMAEDVRGRFASGARPRYGRCCR